MTGRRVCFALLFLVAACESMPGRPLEADRPIRPAQVKSFDELWGSRCAGCHGADGTLGAARPLNDSLYLAWVNDVNLRVIIRQGAARTLMPAFSDAHGGSLTDDQIELLIDEMRDRWGSPDKYRDVKLPAYAAQLGDAKAGAEVYREFCSRCHGPDGTGGEARGSIVDPTYLALVSNQALRSSVVAGRADLGMPDFRNATPDRTMSERQIADVVAWLASHRVEFPGQPLARKEGNRG